MAQKAKIELTHEEQSEIANKAIQMRDLMSKEEQRRKAWIYKRKYILRGLIALVIALILGWSADWKEHAVSYLIWIVPCGFYFFFCLLNITFANPAAALEQVKIEMKDDLIKQKQNPDFAFGDLPMFEIETGFIVSKMLTVKSEDYFSNNAIKAARRIGKLIIDNENKKLIFQKGATYSKAISFADIIRYEIYENGNHMVDSTAGSALLGGLLFGVEGAIIGSSGSKEINKICQQLKLIIYINDFSFSKIEFDYIKTALNMKDETYQSIIENLQEIVSYLEYMINNKEKDI